MTPAEAMSLHESKLLVQENGPSLVTNSACNPTRNTVYYWSKLWHEENFGTNLEPLPKLCEKAPVYAKQSEFEGKVASPFRLWLFCTESLLACDEKQGTLHLL